MKQKKKKNKKLCRYKCSAANFTFYIVQQQFVVSMKKKLAKEKKTTFPEVIQKYIRKAKRWYCSTKKNFIFWYQYISVADLAPYSSSSTIPCSSSPSSSSFSFSLFSPLPLCPSSSEKRYCNKYIYINKSENKKEIVFINKNAVIKQRKRKKKVRR